MNAHGPELIDRPASDTLLEKAFISEFLLALGCDSEALSELPEAVVKELMACASEYASGRLTEIEARAHFVREVLGSSAA